ncbi:MAG: type II toxin-antitoxin system mRNA interferase toxin, RelE/StbE family [Bdellovibrionaceae bacterium]|nr:type II toxin-antitoxin system mRNA interferase toxin, RelE/StbE family [Pseudobdellovibrionaceae bacterium]
MKPTEVLASKKFEKQLKKIPNYIKEAAAVWIASVEEVGIREVRKLKGYHDEPLKGDRKGQRSIRLSKAYRLIYEEDEQKNLVVITILEVNKHEY